MTSGNPGMSILDDVLGLPLASTDPMSTENVNLELFLGQIQLYGFQAAKSTPLP